MGLTLYMDVQVPIAVTEALRRDGLDVLTSQDDRTALLDDELLLERVKALGRILFSQDQDFLRIAAEWQSISRPFPGVIFGAQQRLSIGELIGDLTLILTCSDPDELRDRVTYLPLR